MPPPKTQRELADLVDNSLKHEIRLCRLLTEPIPDPGPRGRQRGCGHQRADHRHGVQRRDLLRHLTEHGCVFLREGGNHTL